MKPTPLQNPIWHSLTSRHRDVALVRGIARRYPPDVAPFAAAAEGTEEAGADLSRLFVSGERVGILSVIPPMQENWIVAKEILIHQFVWPYGLSSEPDPEAVLLDDGHIAAMLELTALVYPAYFRPGTAKLGDYFGIIREGRLVAMAGIRMALDGHQELSAICTHPDVRGQGLAARLTRHLIAHVAAQSDRAFLHTESDNVPANSLYGKLGFVLERRLPFVVFDRR